MPSRLLGRINGGYHRRMARWFGRRMFAVPAGAPIVSFTFDDFPRSALREGGVLLKEFHIAGTYYVSLGLVHQTIPTGEMFHLDDVSRLVADGHELGCHTFHHHPAWETASDIYMTSVLENACQLERIGVSLRLQTHSYPVSYPRPRTKRAIEGRFRGCRGGGQTFNHGNVDLNYLKSFFLEQSRDNFGGVEQVIEANAAAGGWLIFSTHDISETPSRFGCTPAYFKQVVQASIRSEARILSMSAALDAAGAPR